MMPVRTTCLDKLSFWPFAAQLQMRTPQPKVVTEVKGFEEKDKDEEKAKWDDTIQANDARAGDVEDSEACLKVMCTVNLEPSALN